MNIPQFSQFFKDFKFRSPKPRYGNKVDTSALRFIDTATKEDLITEYNKIKEKKSNLPSTERSILTKFFENEA
jgi:hypothetical protein